MDKPPRVEVRDDPATHPPKKGVRANGQGRQRELGIKLTGQFLIHPIHTDAR